MADTKGTQQSTQQASSAQQRNQGETQSSQTIQPTNSEGARQRDLTRRESYAPSLWGTSPFAMMNHFVQEMDRLFEGFGFGRGLAPFARGGLWPGRFAEGGQAAWSPQIEVFEREGQIIVRADLPGMNKDDVKVDITDDALTIQGERKHEHEQCDESFCHTERSFGHFYRSIPLPDGVDADQAKASFRDGVLEITVPAPQRAKHRRQIDIGEETGTQEQPRAGAQTTAKS
jgi:HSP20 family protein